MKEGPSRSANQVLISSHRMSGHVHDMQRFTRRHKGREIPYVIDGRGGYANTTGWRTSCRRTSVAATPELRSRRDRSRIRRSISTLNTTISRVPDSCGWPSRPTRWW